MKLLPKTEINTLKATAQKQAIDEGVKLTRRIDTLREVMASEEQSLNKFRSETLSQIHRETTEAADIRDTLLGEVRELQLAKEEALKPLTDELKLIDEAREDIAKKAALNVTQALTNDTKATLLNQREEEINAMALRAEQREERTIEELKEAEKQKEYAQQLITDATEIHKNSVILKETTELSLSERQSILDSQEASLAQKEQSLEEERIRQAADRIRLNDREAVLEREFNRLKKK